MIVGGGNPGSNINVGNFTPMFTSGQGSDEADFQDVMTVAGTISQFFVRQGTATGAGRNNVWTLRKNGSVTALTCTVPAAATTCSDTTNSVSFSVGDLISVQLTAGAGGGTNTPANWTAKFVP